MDYQVDLSLRRRKKWPKIGTYANTKKLVFNYAIKNIKIFLIYNF